MKETAFFAYNLYVAIKALRVGLQSLMSMEEDLSSQVARAGKRMMPFA